MVILTPPFSGSWPSSLQQSVGVETLPSCKPFPIQSLGGKVVESHQLGEYTMALFSINKHVPIIICIYIYYIYIIHVL